MVFNSTIGLKLLQIPLNVLAQLHVIANVITALLTAPKTVVLLNNLSTLRSHLYNSTTFLYLKWPLLLKIQFLQTIPLLNPHLFISMDSNIIIFLQNLPK